MNNEYKNIRVCSICGKEFTGFGNDPWPVKKGRCCDKCNMEVVIPARLKQIQNSYNGEE